jgi:hypothetical protein
MAPTLHRGGGVLAQTSPTNLADLLQTRIASNMRCPGQQSWSTASRSVCYRLDTSRQAPAVAAAAFEKAARDGQHGAQRLVLPYGRLVRVRTQEGISTMGTAHCHISYRPIRVGWVVKAGDLDGLVRAMQNSCCFWGGTFNPIIWESSDVTAEAKRLRVDILATPDGASFESNAVIGTRWHWPFGFGSLIDIDGVAGSRTQLLDLRHAITQLDDYSNRRMLVDDFALKSVVWADHDPLRYVLTALCGKLPPRESSAFDYQTVAVERLPAKTVHLGIDEKVHYELVRDALPCVLAALEIDVRRRQPAVFVGHANRPTDVAAFWNLRALGVSAVFFDPAYATRLAPLCEEFVAGARQLSTERPRGQDHRVALYYSSDAALAGTVPLVGSPSPIDVGSLQVRGFLSLPELESTFTIASVADDGDAPCATVPLAKKPYADEEWSRGQHAIASLRFTMPLQGTEFTFALPYVPELNEYYGREFHYNYAHVRSEPNSTGLVVDAGDDHVTVSALPCIDVVQKLFEQAGIQARPSQAGRIARRLIRQMGGLQKCRAFKIAGVRALVRDHQGATTFKRSAALQTIGTIKDGKLNFQPYEALYLEPRRSPRLTPEMVFTFLLKREAFAAGLEVRCPSCELESWTSIDDLRTYMECSLCGHRHNVLPALKDRDWSYRCSGLFHQFKNQEGAMPVAILLQQLDANVGDGLSAFSTCLNLDLGDTQRSETDFVWLVNHESNATEIVVGECKNRGPISAEDVKNLVAVAQRLRAQQLDAYVLFAKLTTFSGDEVELCRTAHDPDEPRVIMLTHEDLEPYSIPRGDGRGWADTQLKRLALRTEQMYFRPRDG